MRRKRSSTRWAEPDAAAVAVHPLRPRHPIIARGGSQVNVIPGEVRIETYVRGRTVEAIPDANARADRALRAGALALAAQAEIETLPGYLPLIDRAGMAKPRLTKAQYLAFQRGVARTELFDGAKQ
jgi:metal-dependent amidase/aminoacylase/carboxypeptidase family protein